MNQVKTQNFTKTNLGGLNDWFFIAAWLQLARPFFLKPRNERTKNNIR